MSTRQLIHWVYFHWLNARNTIVSCLLVVTIKAPSLTIIINLLIIHSRKHFTRWSPLHFAYHILHSDDLVRPLRITLECEARWLVEDKGIRVHTLLDTYLHAVSVQVSGVLIIDHEHIVCTLQVPGWMLRHLMCHLKPHDTHVLLVIYLDQPSLYTLRDHLMVN